ncbi:1-phosphofructokinase family hexose kinase [Microbulbifer harenosus]|uniref:Phosphofructokinase n=1 Tax=Microbulbifer harenosus TaxID=2576840 RepID=A0ABY2UHI7_9GAMM|nr:1-phosphofructokinase family hexose kinase [Microbulbifer harenosus]TLM76444.1 1-phosphofructokinase family hexose kinase [Microbulbifer harenosus]
MSIATITLNPCIDNTVRVPQIIPDCKLSCTNVRAYPGGGGLNVARVIHRLGTDVHAYWTCGGENGRRLAQFLDDEHVPNTPVPISESVRENLIVQEESSGNLFRFGMPGPLLSDTERDRWKRQVREISPSSEFVVFSGSLPEGTPPEWYAELLRAVPAGIRVVVDTKMAALRHALKVGVCLIKPNVREMEELVGHELRDDAAIERAMRDVIERGGAEVVILSQGRAGVLLATADRLERISAPSVRLRSKVGAGDAVVGGLLAALSRGKALPDAARFGVAAGAAAVMTEGTELCHRKDVERMYEMMRSNKKKGHAGPHFPSSE